MPRHPFLALGVAALALALGAAVSTRGAAAADEPHKAAAKGDVHPAAANPAELAHEAAAHEEPDILQVQPKLAIWTVVVFVGLLFVLGRFAWKPLLAALHQREEHLEHVLLETERARNESEQLLAEHRRRLTAAEDQIRAMIDEARKNAQSAADEIVRRAQEEADSSKQRAQRDIATARDQALAEIWSKTSDLAVSVAGKVLGRSLGEDEHRRLVDAAVNELPAAPPSPGAPV